jgi:hypothetical protein
MPTEWLIHAEYCGATFYMGWWLYIDPIIDGLVSYKTVSDAGRSTWVRGDSPIGIPRKIHELAARHGSDLPEPERYSQKMAEAFDVSFPNGIVVGGESLWEIDWGISRIPAKSLIAGGRYGGSKPVGEPVSEYEARTDAEEEDADGTL